MNPSSNGATADSTDVTAESSVDSLVFTAYFSDVSDPRIQRCKAHRLLDIIGLTICAVIAGADTFTGIERFGRGSQAVAGAVSGAQ